MRCAVWFSNYGLPDVSFNLPYEARSPVFSKRVKYSTNKDVLNEIYSILDECKNTKYKVGQSLFFQMPFFCDPSQFISDWCWDMISDYHMVKKFHIPLARDLQSANPWELDCFAIIEDEINQISFYEREKNG